VASYLNATPAAVALLTSLAHDDLAISLITYGEIYDGIYAGRDPGAQEAIFRQMLAFVEVLGLNEEIVERFARIRGSLRAAGQIIDDFDILIGATAVHYGLTLVTRNRRHFQRIPGLNLYP